MATPLTFSQESVDHLCARLEIEPAFLLDCVSESIIVLEEVDGTLQFRDATLLQLRRIQRICLTFSVDIPVALTLLRRVSS